MIIHVWGELSPKERVLFRKEVKKIMIDKDLSYGQLAKMTGYSPKTLANCITSSRKPSKFLVNTLIDVLNINFNEIRRLANGE